MDFLTGPFNHDMMILVMLDLYPELRPGVDYQVAQQEGGPPFFAQWKSGMKPPNADLLFSEFKKDEHKYRDRYIRMYRGACLASSDARVPGDVPEDSPYRAKMEEWKTYRQALRDVTAQDGYPFTLQWPTMPVD